MVISSSIQGHRVYIGIMDLMSSYTWKDDGEDTMQSMHRCDRHQLGVEDRTRVAKRQKRSTAHTRLSSAFQDCLRNWAWSWTSGLPTFTSQVLGCHVGDWTKAVTHARQVCKSEPHSLPLSRFSHQETSPLTIPCLLSCNITGLNYGYILSTDSKIPLIKIWFIFHLQILSEFRSKCPKSSLNSVLSTLSDRHNSLIYVCVCV